MIITNKLNLPAPLVAAVTPTRTPDPSRFSVTELILLPQIRVLRNRHWDEIEEDASSRIWAAVGSLMHVLLEKHGKNLPGQHVECTVETEVEGETVSGQIDLYDEDSILSDYKLVSVWTTMRGVPADWEAQVNLYAELLRRKGHHVRGLRIVAMYRDWSKHKAFEHGYPREQVETFTIPLWDSARATRYMSERIRLHRTADAGQVEECSPADRWAKRTAYAVMKVGNKKATSVLYNERAAEEAAAAKPNHYVEVRPGQSTRCVSYCNVSRFCPQYARIKAEAAGDDDERPPS